MEDELAAMESLVRRKHPYLLKGGGYSCAEAALIEWQKRQAAAAGRIKELQVLIKMTKERIARMYSDYAPDESRYHRVRRLN